MRNKVDSDGNGPKNETSNSRTQPVHSLREMILRDTFPAQSIFYGKRAAYAADQNFFAFPLVRHPFCDYRRCADDRIPRSKELSRTDWHIDFGRLLADYVFFEKGIQTSGAIQLADCGAFGRRSVCPSKIESKHKNKQPEGFPLRLFAFGCCRFSLSVSWRRPNKSAPAFSRPQCP